MNIFFWVLQILLALHTLMGAFWKFSNSSAAVSATSPLPQWLWLGLSIVEILAVVGLVLPASVKSLGKWSAYAAIVIAAEMLLLVIWNLLGGTIDMGSIIYWLVVLVFSAFLAYGRMSLKPIKPE